MGARHKRYLYLVAAAVVAGGQFASVARADTFTELQFDVNSITIQAITTLGANTPFTGVGFTGSLMFGIDGNSDVSLYRDGDHQTSYDSTFVGFSGEIDLNAGISTGGHITVSVLNPDTTIDQYSFTIDAGVHVTRPLGMTSFRTFGYQLNSDTENGLFTDANYGGVDVTDFFLNQPLSGSFFELKYRPDPNGFSDDGDVDIYTDTVISVPLPGTADAGFVLIGLLGISRWRRNRRLSDRK